MLPPLKKLVKSLRVGRWKFGINGLAASHHRRLIEVFDRQGDFDALPFLTVAVRPEREVHALATTAVALDSSVFLRLGGHVDVVDYFNTRHSAPLILPGQSVQEFWNNQLQVIESLASGIKKKFESLKSDVLKIDSEFGDYSSRFEALISEFSGSFGYMYDEATARRTIALLELLQEKGVVDYVPRSRFSDIAAQRKITKTPPGFKDDGDGDFFVWADSLYSLLKSRSDGAIFTRFVMVSNDKKVDWSRESVPHPILSAEVHKLVGVPFEIWDVKKLTLEVAAAG